MSHNEPSFVAKRIGGRYLVCGRVSPFQSAIAGLHEEAHGILRRSSLYGAILTSLRRHVEPGSTRAQRFALHGLASRSRTSEEVHATYQSCRQAGAWRARRDEVRGYLDQFPSYRMYFEIGEELVGRETNWMLANAALDSIVRFCWSALPLTRIDFPVTNVNQVRTLRPDCYPEARFRSMRETWTDTALRELVEASLGDDSRSLRELLDVPQERLSDPVGGTLTVPPDAVLIPSPGFTSEAQRLKAEHRQALGELQEFVVQRGYDFLVARHADTALAAVPQAELLERVTRIPEEDWTSAEVPEVTILRDQRIALVTSSEREPPLTRGMAFCRPRDRFHEQFTVRGPDLALQSQIVCYGFGPSDPRRNAVEPWPARVVGAEAGNVATQVAVLCDPQVTLVVFASAIALAEATVMPELMSLAVLGRSIWIAADVAPRDCARMLRRWGLAFRAFWHAASHPNLGGLVVPSVGDIGFLDGAVFPGSKAAMQGLVGKILMDELGSSLRGFGHAILIQQESIERQRVGTMVTDWLVSTELRLG